MNTEQERSEFEAWCETRTLETGRDHEGDYISLETYLSWEGYQAARATLQSQHDEETKNLRDALWIAERKIEALESQDREDALIEAMLEACSEWSQYVEVDSAPRTLREHVQLAIDNARCVEGEGE